MLSVNEKFKQYRLKEIYSKKNNILSKKYKLNLKDYGYFT